MSEFCLRWLYEFILVYTVLRFMAEAWDLASHRFFLKAWLKAELLSLHQVSEVEVLICKHHYKVDGAVSPQHGTATRTKEASLLLW